MNIQIMSDLHFEFRISSLFPKKSANRFSLINKFSSENTNVLVLAGDIATEKFIKDVLQAFSDKFPKVIYVPGNHEYYGTHAQKHADRLREVSNKIPNLCLLDSDKVNIGGKTFVGGTLWFKQNQQANKYKRLLGDFSAIRSFEPWVYQKNEETIKFFDSILGKADVVITHHVIDQTRVVANPLGYPGEKFLVGKFNNNFVIEV